MENCGGACRWTGNPTAVLLRVAIICMRLVLTLVHTSTDRKHTRSNTALSILFKLVYLASKLGKRLLVYFLGILALSSLLMDPITRVAIVYWEQYSMWSQILLVSKKMHAEDTFAWRVCKVFLLHLYLTWLALQTNFIKFRTLNVSHWCSTRAKWFICDHEAWSKCTAPAPRYMTRPHRNYRAPTFPSQTIRRGTLAHVLEFSIRI